jgi:branched-chain amino acid transport system ATP-binding protein
MSHWAGPILEVRNLTVSYGQVEAVRNVTLEILAGEFVSIIGNNGAGKSSTLKAIAGIVRPVKGEIWINGTTAEKLRSHQIVRMGVSLVPEGRMIFADQTVKDNLLLGAYSRRVRNQADIDFEFDRIFSLFPVLAQRLHQLGGSLSGGEQQMLALARGLFARPRLLMIDEMSLGLAPKVVEALIVVLKELNREGLTILLVEQLATVALKVADRGYVFENSRIALSGTSDELAKNPRVIETYLGRRQLE